jgi:signal peptidase I
MGPRYTIFSIFKEISQTALISLAIFFFVYVFLVQPHRIKGESMVPNFADGELILSEKITYRFGKPKRGDVVVFQAPPPNRVDFIKRVVGLPGESVEIEDGEVFVDGKKLVEPYETQKTEGTVNVKLALNQYFVLGDNRRSSSDSRVFGPIDKKSIKGRAWLVYWPIVASGDSQGKRIISRVDYSVSDSL